jgi:hypothetical protein
LKSGLLPLLKALQGQLQAEANWLTGGFSWKLES